MEVKINVDKLNREQLVQILAIVAGQSAEVKPVVKAEPKIPEEDIIEVGEPEKLRTITPEIEKKKLDRDYKFWTEKEVTTALKLHDSGMSHKDIGDRLGRSEEGVDQLFYRIKKDVGSKAIKSAVRKYKKVSKRFTKTEVRTVLVEHKNGNTPERIAKLIHRDKSAVVRLIYRLDKPQFHSQAIKEVIAGNE